MQKTLTTETPAAIRWLVYRKTLTLVLALALGLATARGNNLYWNTTTGAWDVGVTANWTGGASLFANGDAVNFTNTSGGTITVTAGGVLPVSTTVSAASGTYTIAGGPMGGTNILTKAGAGTLVLSGANTFNAPVTHNAGKLSINTLGNVGGGASALGAPTTAANGTIQFAGDATLTYTGAATSSDRLLNLTGSGVSIVYNNGSGTLRLSGGITGSGAVSFRARGAGNITITGLLALGAGTVSRTDGGTLTLLNPGNSFSGNVTAYAGTISIDSIANGGTPSTLGRGTNVTFGQVGFNGFGKLQFTGPGGGSSDRSLTINSKSGTADGGIIENTVAGQTLTLSGNLGVGGPGPSPQLQFVGAGDGVMSGIIGSTATNALAITKSGSGTWLLTGANSYRGSTTVLAGTLNTTTGSTGAGSYSNNATLGVSIAAPGQQLNMSSLGLGTSTLNIMLDAGNPTAPVIAVAGALTLGVSVTVNVLGGANLTPSNIVLLSYGGSGGAGTFAAGTLPSVTGYVTSLTNDTAARQLKLLFAPVPIGAPVRWAAGDGNWDTATANWQLWSGGSLLTYTENAPVRFDDNATGPSPITVILTTSHTPGGVTVDGTKDYNLTGAAISGTNGLVKNGAGRLTLSGTNTYSGPTLLNGGILAVVGDATSYSTCTALGTGEVTVGSGAQLNFSEPHYHTFANPLTLNGDGPASSGALYFGNSNWRLTGHITLASDASVSGAQNNMLGTINLGTSTLTVRKNSGVSDIWGTPLSGSGGLTLDGSGSTLTLTGANTYTGPTTINAGVLSVGSIGNGGAASSPIGSANSAAASLVLGGGTLRYTGSTAATDRGFTLAAGTTSTIEVTSAATTLTWNGAGAAAGGGLAKTGAGTLRLSSTNLYRGPTTISDGTLALSASGSIASSSSINVLSGATLNVSAAPFTVGPAQTLTGSGTILGSVIVNGTLSPGTDFGSGGVLAFNSGLTLAPGSTTVMQVSRNGRALANACAQVAGALTYGGTLVIADAGASPLQVGDSFQLFNAGSRGGAFGSIVFPPGYTFAETLATDGRIVVISAPPPPGFNGITASGANLRLTWPNNYLGWMVESNAVGLANSNAWFDVPGSETVTNLSYTINPSLTNVFYRMHSMSSADFASDPLVTGPRGLNIDAVWSAVPVGIACLTLQNVQMAAYYNSNRFLEVAARNLDSTNWHYQTTTELYAGWDVHNYIAMSADSSRCVHISANMHNMQMNYYRSAQPVTNAEQFDAAGFVQQIYPIWNATYEGYSTYPSFLTGPNQELLFSYRAHNSNNSLGWWFFLKYNSATRTYSNPAGAVAPFAWTNIYSVYPNWAVNGGYLHVLYVWRGSGDAASNFRLSYVRTMDMTNWTDAFGRPLTLPLTTNSTMPIVDDVPQRGGLLNGQPKLGFDRGGVPLVAYHKYDAAGHSQAYVARPNPGSLSWNIVQLTHSSWRWNFSGGGALPPGGNVANSFLADDPLDGLATLSVSMTDLNGYRDTNSGNYTFDETTLNSVAGSYPDPATFYSANQPQANANYVDSAVVNNPYYDTNRAASMQVRRLRSSGVAFAGNTYYLRWETLPSDNRDAVKRDASGVPINPPPSALQMFRTAANFDAALYGVLFKPANATLFGAMTRTIDPARAFGSSLASPVSGQDQFAQWTFSVASDGDYVLCGSAYAVLGTNGSFWVQVDNGPLVDWRISGYWNYQPVTSGPIEGTTRFHLPAGTHKLRLYAQQPGTKIEYLWLNLPSTGKTPSLGPLSYAGFSLTPDAGAVCGYSLGSAAGSNPAGATAHYQIPVPQSGNYLLLGRTRAKDANSDSFYLSLNDGTTQTWTLPISGTNWTWQAIGATRSFSAGALSLDVSGRDGGAELDSLMLLKAP